MDKSTAVIIAITVPIGLIVLVTAIVCLVRRLMDKSRMGSIVYDRISHELDDEEMEFKRSIEMRNNDGSAYDKVEYSDENSDDEDDELYGFGMDDETGFGTKDMERLNMLDKFRSNLVAGAGAAMHVGSSSSSGDGVDETNAGTAIRGTDINVDVEKGKANGNMNGGASNFSRNSNDVDGSVLIGSSDTVVDEKSELPELRI